MQLKDFVPPIVVRLAARFRHRRRLHDSYESALASCRHGYEDEQLTRMVHEKTRLYRDSLGAQQPLGSDPAALRALVALSLASRGDALNVIDVGGACGAHYFLARRMLGGRINMRWHVVETAAMASRAADLEDGQLKFYDDLQKARIDLDRADLVFSSGALQYVPSPYETLGQLVECGAESIFITRVGLTTLPKELVIVQKSRLSSNGPGPIPPGMRDAPVEYPVTFARKDRFEEILSRRYRIDVLFDEDRGAYQAAGHSIDMHGYFGARRS